MKKLMSIFGAALFVFALASCGPAEEKPADDAKTDEKTETPNTDDKKDADTK